MDQGDTARFEIITDRKQQAHDIMAEVMISLEEKGYNPINQLVGYFLSGDPTYITNHKGARGVIRRMERDDLLAVIIKDYVEQLD
ncbi:MAG: IreB family regulatory phosphoprotein [Clostridiaceae bacterium]|nr:IreB family regulatory phosphoprotein [Clostridiaceae bacterium]NLW54751.1 IreB family regulatory phosphoprotein [Clostridiaceae bacterium]HZJ91187.1 IreB family regulatory phosphoprotein [Oscillospiraceae bacterium]